MAAVEAEITTLPKTGLRHACVAPTRIPRVTTPPRRGETTLHPARGRRLPPASRTHRHPQPLPEQNPSPGSAERPAVPGSEATTGLPKPRAPAAHGPVLSRARPRSSGARSAQLGRHGRRGSGAPPPLATTPAEGTRGSRSPGWGDSSLALGRRRPAGASEGGAGGRPGGQ